MDSTTTEYVMLHRQMRERRPRPDWCDRCAVGACENCHKRKKLDLASVGGTYTENPDDWLWLCRICHIRMDKGGQATQQPTETSPCAWCKRPFMPKRAGQKTCSPKCAGSYSWHVVKKWGGGT